MSEAGYEINDPVDVGDLSDQTGQELMEAAKAVHFTVREVKLQTVEDKETKDILFKKLNVQAKIGPLGVDGNGRYAGKVQFAELMAWFDQERYNSDWWKKQARFPLKSFMQAIGFDPKAIPSITDEFRESLKGKEFTADIAVVPIQIKQNGKYVDSGDKKNELRNFKAIKAE